MTMCSSTTSRCRARLSPNQKARAGQWSCSAQSLSMKNFARTGDLLPKQRRPKNDGVARVN
jgi:hypothetical protein